MAQFFKNKERGISNLPEGYYETLCEALKSTMAVCVASTSALVVNKLTAKIHPERMTVYQTHSLIAVNKIGELRSFLFRIEQHLEEKNYAFLDARSAINHITQRSGVANCEHQAFYLASLLRQKEISAFIYDIEDINHTVVITKNFLLDPWIGDIFSLSDAELGEFYSSSLNMNASWLNRLLSNKELTYNKQININTRRNCFKPQNEQKELTTSCCTLF